MQILKGVFFDAFAEIKAMDEKFHCIEPDKSVFALAITLYWGIHCLKTQKYREVS
jgi:hypothetical protein